VQFWFDYVFIRVDLIIRDGTNLHIRIGADSACVPAGRAILCTPVRDMFGVSEFGTVDIDVLLRQDHCFATMFFATDSGDYQKRRKDA
jgi:hypothetical protein